MCKITQKRQYASCVLFVQAEWIKPDNRPPDDWPDRGSIAIEEFDLKYREGLPLVLRQISCDVKPGEKLRFCYIERNLSMEAVKSSSRSITRSLHTYCTLESTLSRIFLFLEL